jgi:prephenate dehydrogenase
MSPESHDAAFAAVSHLPHLIAFAMMNAITSQPNGRDFLSLAGPGFRDFTRIAASDPKMWRDVLLANREELLAQSQLFQRTLQALDLMIQSGNGEALEGLISQASQTRAKWRMTANKPPA